MRDLLFNPGTFHGTGPRPQSDSHTKHLDPLSDNVCSLERIYVETSNQID